MFKKSDIGNRIMAGLVDMVIAWVPTLVLPGLGGILGLAYILTRDTVVYQFQKQEEWKNKSIGKKLFGLKVKRLNGEETVDYSISMKRNLPLCIGSIIGIIPVIGWIFGSLIGFIVAVIEIILIFTDENGQRLGDKFAETQVVEADDTSNEEKGEVIDIDAE
ncbi:MAG: RDD family protein [Halanaerobiales bacterium]